MASARQSARSSAWSSGAIGTQRVRERACPRHRDQRVGILAPQRPATGGVRQFIVGARECAGIGATDGDAAIAGIGGRRTGARSADREQVQPELSAKVLATAMLLVERIGQADGDASQRVARRIQHLGAEIEQAADRSAGERPCHVDLALLALQHDLAPSGLNVQHRDPDLHVRYLLQPHHAPLDLVASNSFGFGGSNACLLFGRAA